MLSVYKKIEQIFEGNMYKLQTFSLFLVIIVDERAEAWRRRQCSFSELKEASGADRVLIYWLCGKCRLTVNVFPPPPCLQS